MYTGKELAAELARIRQRVDNIELLSADIVINLLLSYRDIQVGSYSLTYTFDFCCLYATLLLPIVGFSLTIQLVHYIFFVDAI